VDAAGNNTWFPQTKGPHRYVETRDPDAIAVELNALIATPPRSGGKSSGDASSAR
jgi:hypothetical protein